MSALVLFCLLAAPPYDPLAVDAAAKVEAQVFTVKDAKRDGRELPIRVYFPPGVKSAAPVLLFSHGLGGSNENDVFLAEHWARRGYVAVFVQHPGSDTSVWKDLPPGKRMASMRKAASVENFMLRVSDIPAVLDALTSWNAADGHALKGRLDLDHVGMSGHSFGAITTQAVSGQQFALGSFTEPRIKAAVAFSPSLPKRGTAEEAFGKVSTPWLLMTGTNDGSPIGDTTAESRRGVFKALAAGSKYELVLDGAEHSAFSDRALPGDQKPRNPNHHRVMRAFTTAFFDAYLRGDAAARAWLDGAGAKALLEPKDAWQTK
ncbi:MAG: hypothetical protein QM817_38355 [Archangium sp.]